MSKFLWDLKNTRFYHNFNLVKAVWINKKTLYMQLSLSDHDKILRLKTNSCFWKTKVKPSFFGLSKHWEKSWENPLNCQLGWITCVQSKLTFYSRSKCFKFNHYLHSKCFKFKYLLVCKFFLSVCVFFQNANVCKQTH